MNWMAQTMMWIMLSLAISIAISFVVPFPYSLAVIIPVFIGISFLIRRRQMARMGMGGQGGGGFGGMLGGGGISYVCIACGHKFKGGACPRCGSKMRRADF